MKTYIFIIILCLSNLSIIAQEKITNLKKNHLEFSTGYHVGFLKNLAFAPVSRYDYNALNYQLKYTRITKREKLFEVHFGYIDSELKSDLIPEPAPLYSKFILDFSSMKKVFNRNRFTIYIGLQSQTSVSSYFKWKHYDFQQKLGIASRFNFEIDEKHSLSSKLTLPFMMWRTSTFEENLYSLNRYQSILWTTSYKYKLSDHFDLNASYNFNYDRLQIFNAYRELQHQINLGINFKF